MLDSKVTLNKIENKVRAISGQRSKQTITWNAVKEALGIFNFFFFLANPTVLWPQWGPSRTANS